MAVQSRRDNHLRRTGVSLVLAGVLASGVLVTGCQDTTAATTSSRHGSLSHNQRLGKQLAARRGWKSHHQWSCLKKLWMQESGWRTKARNPSGAYGIPQSLPGRKMAKSGPDWRTNPRTQIRWGLSYIRRNYGTPCGAWRHEVRWNWY